MKILQFMASAGYGGAENVFVELSNSLACRHQVTALLLRDCVYKNRFDKRVTITELQANPTTNNPFLHFEIFKVLKRLQPDIVHTHAAKGAMLVHRVNRFLQIPHLATKHNDRKGRIFNSLPWVSAVSEKGAASVHSSVNGTVRTIYNGLTEESVNQSQANDIFTMLAVGRLDAIKGFDVLIEQVAKLDFPFTLNIVGDGPELANLQDRTVKLGLQDHVQFLGLRDDIPQLMHDSDLVVITSHREGGPKVVIEALYYAPLVLSTPVGMVPELLQDKLQTSHETLADDIIRLYQSFNKYKDLFNDLREVRKDDFSMEKVISGYEKYYSEILTAIP